MIIDAIKVNEHILKYSKSPHKRDLARMRLRILKKKKEKITEEWERKITLTSGRV